MSIIKFLLTNWDSVVVVIAAAAGVIVLYRRGEVILLESLLFTLVIQAEKDFGGGTGELKKAAVITWVYERLPKIVTIIISRKTIEGLLGVKGTWGGNAKENLDTVSFVEYISNHDALQTDENGIPTTESIGLIMEQVFEQYAEHLNRIGVKNNEEFENDDE